MKNKIIWLTGLSGSGKSTIANELKSLNYFNIDGDILRSGLCSDLGFLEKDRKENIRRAAHLANIVSEYMPVVVSLISPFEEDRLKAKEITNCDIIYIKCDIETCKIRDPKGLYKKNIKNFTGIDSPYEIPMNPDLILDTQKYTLKECLDQLSDFLVPFNFDLDRMKQAVESPGHILPNDVKSVEEFDKFIDSVI